MSGLDVESVRWPDPDNWPTDAEFVVMVKSVPADFPLCDCGVQDGTSVVTNPDDRSEVLPHHFDCSAVEGWAAVRAWLGEQIEAAQAEAWESGHTLGEALAYNAVGDILWERHRDVIARSEYARHRAARAESLPHWDTNPYRAAQIAPSRVPSEET